MSAQMKLLDHAREVQLHGEWYWAWPDVNGELVCPCKTLFELLFSLRDAGVVVVS